jgi:hypothetical protein
MSIKNLLVRLAEKITGRKCCRCANNCGGVCKHPYEGAFSKCWQSLTRPGFVRSESLAYVELGTAAAEGFLEGMHHQLTEEEQHQLQKIKDALQVAGETARACGLLVPDPDPEKAVPADMDDRTESGLLEED